MKRRKAFTLIELLITMTLLVILMSAASQNYHHLFSQQALVASAERLYHFLDLAKSESIKLNKKVYVHFCQKGETQEWKMSMSEQGSCDCFVENSCLLNGLQKSAMLSDGQLVVTSSADITFTGQQASYNSMRFSVNAGSIVLHGSAGGKLKVIQSAIRLRICSLDNEQFGYKRC